MPARCPSETTTSPQLQWRASPRLLQLGEQVRFVCTVPRRMRRVGGESLLISIFPNYLEVSEPGPLFQPDHDLSSWLDHAGACAEQLQLHIEPSSVSGRQLLRASVDFQPRRPGTTWPAGAWVVSSSSATSPW